MAKLPLEGIRVIGLAVVWSGPYACRLLADWGAEVIRMESRQHFQYHTRGYIPRPPEALIENRIGYSSYKKQGYDPATAHNAFAIFNGHAANSLSMTANLRTAEGMDTLKRLVQASDVLIENNSPTVRENLGLTWELIREWNPKLIMLSMPGFGDSGPYRYYRAFGVQMDAFIGHGNMRCYLDEEFDTQSIVFHADEAAGLNAALAVMMALYQRLNTGKGQFIDLGQAETSLCHLGQAVMDYTMNQRITEKSGNRDYHGALQGCYRCRDVSGKWAVDVEYVDSWVNITITNDQEWAGFGHATGDLVWTRDDRFSSTLGRYQHHDELDKLIEAWTMEHDNYEVMHILQREGVPAGPVMDEKDAYSDPHLKMRGFFNELTHPVCGTHFYPGIPWKMSGTPNKLRLPPCCLGEHNEYVYKEVIGVSDEEYEELKRKGHIGTDYAPEIIGEV